MRVVTINALNCLFLQPVRERPIEISSFGRVTRGAKLITSGSQQGPRSGLVNRVARQTIERVSIVRAKQPPTMDNESSVLVIRFMLSTVLLRYQEGGR